MGFSETFVVSITGVGGFREGEASSVLSLASQFRKLTFVYEPEVSTDICRLTLDVEPFSPFTSDIAGWDGDVTVKEVELTTGSLEATIVLKQFGRYKISCVVEDAGGEVKHTYEPFYANVISAKAQASCPYPGETTEFDSADGWSRTLEASMQAAQRQSGADVKLAALDDSGEDAITVGDLVWLSDVCDSEVNASSDPVYVALLADPSYTKCAFGVVVDILEDDGTTIYEFPTVAGASAPSTKLYVVLHAGTMILRSGSTFNPDIDAQKRFYFNATTAILTDTSTDNKYVGMWLSSDMSVSVDETIVIDDTPIEMDHNDLNNIQGGSAVQRYHLTSAQQSGLTGGANTTLHFHNADRDRANHSGTQTADTISDFDSACGDVIESKLVDGDDLEWDIDSASGEMTGMVVGGESEALVIKYPGAVATPGEIVNVKTGNLFDPQLNTSTRAMISDQTIPFQSNVLDQKMLKLDEDSVCRVSLGYDSDSGVYTIVGSVFKRDRDFLFLQNSQVLGVEYDTDRETFLKFAACENKGQIYWAFHTRATGGGATGKITFGYATTSNGYCTITAQELDSSSGSSFEDALGIGAILTFDLTPVPSGDGAVFTIAWNDGEASALRFKRGTFTAEGIVDTSMVEYRTVTGIDTTDISTTDGKFRLSVAPINWLESDGKIVAAVGYEDTSGTSSDGGFAALGIVDFDSGGGDVTLEAADSTPFPDGVVDIGIIHVETGGYGSEEVFAWFYTLASDRGGTPPSETVSSFFAWGLINDASAFSTKVDLSLSLTISSPALAQETVDRFRIFGTGNGEVYNYLMHFPVDIAEDGSSWGASEDTENVAIFGEKFETCDSAVFLHDFCVALATSMYYVGNGSNGAISYAAYALAQDFRDSKFGISVEDNIVCMLGKTNIEMPLANRTYYVGRGGGIQSTKSSLRLGFSGANKILFMDPVFN
jgi:hypothetical protein